MNDIVAKIRKRIPVFYKNDKALVDPGKYLSSLSVGYEDICEASDRLERFAPLIARLFPETKNGIIESPMIRVDNLKKNIHSGLKGDLYFKLDSHLAIAGSIKARGGIYAVLKLTEDLLLKEGLLGIDEDYTKICEKPIREFLSGQQLSVASTGNLGLGVGTMGTKLGYPVIVHMSKDAKQWKKDRLIKNNVKVIEHPGDFTKAAGIARKEAEKGENIHFIDDEKSIDLFLGYAVAAIRMSKELENMNIKPTTHNPLYIYLPCGVGGAPGGITFGLKHIYGDKVKCYFAEPVSSPSMMLGVMTGEYGNLNVRFYGLDNETELDGLAVASPSDFVSPLMEKLCDGFYTVLDEDMFKYLYIAGKSESIRIEPSAAAGIPGPAATGNLMKTGTHIVWTTGGLFVPNDIYDKMYSRGKKAYEDSWH